MQVFVDCIHCFLKQSVICMHISGIDEERQYQVLFDLMDDIKTIDRNNTPAENSTDILLKVYKLINDHDPYREAKIMSNKMALEFYCRLKEFLVKSENRIYDALRISVSGNVIDLGINRSFNIGASLRDSLNTDFSKNEYEKFVHKLNKTQDVVIIGDNAGEIVFDRVLAEELVGMGKKVTYIVKGGPILNDATVEDAVQSGIDKVCRVIDTGTNYLGVPLHKVSTKVKSLLEDSDLIISKGQANFESLEHQVFIKDRVFFLLKIKCEIVARVAGANFGDIVFFTR